MDRDIYREISELVSQGSSCVVVTVAAADGHGPMTVGKKMLVRRDGSSMGTVGGGALEHEAIENCRSVFNKETSELQNYLLDDGGVKPGYTTIPMICGGTVQLFYEYLSGGEAAFIFGGGHVGRALARQLDFLGFFTTVVEDREDIFTQVKEGQNRVHEAFHNFASNADINASSYVIVCTPSHENDYDVVRALTDRGVTPRYLGMLASPAKKADFEQRMRVEYGADCNLSHVYSPIGLDIGGSTPEEIAVAVAAEILTIKHQRRGNIHMRDAVLNPD